MSIFSRLSCCCNSKGRKNKTDVPEAAAAGKGDEGGMEGVDMRTVEEKVAQLVSGRNDEASEMAKIRDVAYSLIKKATIDIVHSRIINKVPNEAFAAVLGRELVKIHTHPEFAELVKVIVDGPTQENREKAEKFSYNIACFLIQEAEKDVPMTLEN